MYLKRLRHLKNDNNANLRCYIRYLCYLTRTKTDNLNKRDRSYLQNTFVEKLSNLTDSNIDIVESGKLDNNNQTYIDDIFNKTVIFRDNYNPFEKEFSWALNSDNKRTSYFLCSMLKLVLKSDGLYINNYPAINLAPKDHIKPKQKPSKNNKNKINIENKEEDDGNKKSNMESHHFGSIQNRGKKNQDIDRGIDYYLSKKSPEISINSLTTNDSKKPLNTFISKNESVYLNEILEICPNKNSSPIEDILETCEIVSIKLNNESIESIKKWIITIGNIYTLTHKNVNEQWEIFTTEDKNLINWLYKNLINKHSFISLEPAKDIESKKLSIINMIDVLYATNSKEDFDLEIKRIKDTFSRKKATTEKVDISLDRARWEKVKVLAGGKSDAKAMSALKKLIDEAYKDLH